MRVLCFHSAQVKAKEKNISTYADGARFGSWIGSYDLNMVLKRAILGDLRRAGNFG